jgi:hypothetical protein
LSSGLDPMPLATTALRSQQVGRDKVIPRLRLFTARTARHGIISRGN